MTRPGRSPLRTVVLLALGVLTVLDAIVAVNAWRSYQRSEDDVLRTLEAEAAIAAESVASGVASLQSALVALSAAPAVQDVELDRIERLLGEAVDELGFSGGIGLVDTDGMLRLVVGTEEPAGSVDLSDRAYVQDVLRTNAPAVSDVLLGRLTNRPLLAVAVPTQDAAGALSGVLVGFVSLDEVPPSPLAPDEVATWFVDRNGAVITGPTRVESLVSVGDHVAVVAAREGGVRGALGDVTGLGGDEVVVGYARAEALGWTAVVEQPRSVALGGAERELRTTVLILAAVTVLGLGGALLVGRRLEGDGALLAAALDEERAAKDRLRRLETMALDLGREADLAGVASVAVEGVAAALGAERAGIALAEADPDRDEDDAVRLCWVAIVGAGTEEVTREHPVLGVGAPVPTAEAFRNREAVWVDRADELVRRYPRMAGSPAGASGTVAALPLLFGGHDLGVLVVQFAREEALPPTDRAVLVTVAEQVAQALGRVTLLQEQARRRARAEAMQSFTAAISRAAGERPVVQAIAGHGAVAAGADLAMLAILEPGTDRIDMHHGSDPASVGAEDWPPVRLGDPTPIAAAVREDRTIVLRDDRERTGQSPDEVRRLVNQLGIVSTAAIPLRSARGSVLGALGLAWYARQPFDEAQVAELEELAEVAAQALDRAGFYEQERHTRLRAERLNGIVAQLATASSAEEAARAVLDGALAGVRARCGAVVLVPDDEADPPPPVTARIDPGGPGWATLEGVAAEAIDRARTVAVGHAEELPGELPEVAGAGPPAFGTVVAVPLLDGAHSLGALVVAWAEPRPLLPGEDAFLAILGVQAGQALARIRVFEREHRIASELQRALLPGELEVPEHVSVAACYLPAAEGADVGGDWYDAIPYRDGRVMLVVGDVVGHGIASAAAMGRLASAARALAVNDPEPAALLSALDRVAARDATARMTTCVAVLVDPATGTVRWSTAGHPPPIVRHGDGQVEVLEGARSTPLGVLVGPRPEAVLTMTAATTLVLYTDGLVERRWSSIDDGIGRLAKELASPDGPVEVRLDRLLAAGLDGADHPDDVVLLCATVAPHPARFRRLVPAEPVRLAQLRDDLRAWLIGRGVMSGDLGDLLLAINEGVTNAVEHGHEGDGRPILVDAAFVADDELEVRIADEGRWRTADGGELRGFGLPLIRRLVDEVDLHTDERGTVLTLRKHISIPAASGVG